VVVVGDKSKIAEEVAQFGSVAELKPAAAAQ
jgi:hypothetical protein